MKTALTLLFFLIAIQTSAGAQQHQIRIAFPSVGTLVTGQVGMVLQKTDILAKHGFKAQITPMPLGKELKEAMIAGQTDVIFTSEANFVILLGQGFECYAISSLGTGGEMALVVKPDSAIRQIGDLRGKRVATIFGTSLHQPAVEWLKEAGLELGHDVTLMNMRGLGPMHSAFATGNIEGIVTFDPYLLEGLKKKQYRALRKTDLDLVVVMSSEYAKKNNGVIREFNAMLKDAAFYVATHREDANRWASQLSGTSVETLDEGSRVNRNYEAKTLAQVDIGISDRFRRKLIRLNDFLFREKLIEKKVPIEEYIRHEK